MFDLDIIELPTLERIDGTIRRYKTPDGLLYPSVTTVLGSMDNKEGLKEWRKRVGDEEADRVSGRSATRGTNVHRLCENLVLNEQIDLKKEMPINVHLYKQLERKLIPNLTKVQGSETFLYSDKLKVAGACDLIGHWKGKPAIIDFKTSARNKPKEWISGYFLQTALYAFMWFERTGLMHPWLVILIAVEEENEAQVFIEKTKDWIYKAKLICEKYHSGVYNQI